MGFLKNAMEMLRKYPLCDHCLGRKFALLGYNIENDERGRAIKLALVLKSHKVFSEKNLRGYDDLQILISNGFSQEAKDTSG